MTVRVHNNATPLSETGSEVVLRPCEQICNTWRCFQLQLRAAALKVRNGRHAAARVSFRNLRMGQFPKLVEPCQDLTHRVSKGFSAAGVSEAEVLQAFRAKNIQQEQIQRVSD